MPHSWTKYIDFGVDSAVIGGHEGVSQTDLYGVWSTTVRGSIVG